jgi:hypothetical protein
MSASTDPREAQLDALCDRIMKMSLEELAESEGKTVQQILEEGQQLKERVLARIRRQFPDFGKGKL